MIFNAPLFRFIQQEGTVQLRRLILLSGLGGISSTGLVALINQSASIEAKGQSATWQFFAFLLLLFLYMLALKRSNKENVASTQNLMHAFKLRIMSQVLKSDLKTIDSIGRPWILQTLVRDTQTVSQSVLNLVQIAQSGSTIFFLMIYLAIVSFPAFVMIFIASCLMFILVSKRLSETNKVFKSAWHQEGENFQIFSDFMDGFKEIKMNSRRAAEISHEMVQESRKTKFMKTEAMFAMVNTSTTPQLLFYLLVAVAVFVLPVLIKDYSQSVQSVTTSIMFLVGALGGVVQNIPAIAQANASAEELFQLEEKLNKIKVDDSDNEDQDPPIMQSLELRNVIYHYDEAKNQASSFVLGPISYTFEAGKIYFVRGNNGSGKSTLIRILIGLYEPSAGGLYVNGDLVKQPSTLAYRNLFSVVFSDFYLFKKLYGIYLANDEVVDAAIDLLEMGDKIKIENRVISDIHLSTGQKKRIALITAILEDRQVIVLDEWASDQDPEFRKYFYQFILPELQRRGKTIIAITHDDQYYHLSDSIFEISKGVLINTK